MSRPQDNAAQEVPVDLERLARPDPDAYRLIAEALGARFEGDPLPVALAETEGLGIETFPASSHPRKGSAASNCPAEPGLATLLDRIPVALVVVDGERIAYVNRAALIALGHTEADDLTAAGGLAALFGDDKPSDGSVSVATAGGTHFAAKVTLSPVDWGAVRALLLTIVPTETANSAADITTGEDAAGLIEALPTPAALVEGDGAVVAANAAFLTATGRTHPPRTLGEVLDGAAGDALLSDLRDHAGGPLSLRGSVGMGGIDHTVTIGVAGGHRLVTFLAVPGMDEADVGPLQAAVDQVRKLVDRAAVALVVDGPLDEAWGRAPEGAAPWRQARFAQFFRTLLLATSARVREGTTVTVRQSGEGLLLAIDPSDDEALQRAEGSDSVKASARAAGARVERWGPGALRARFPTADTAVLVPTSETDPLR
ncbi:MAG: PAS domain-containing protein [Pseudomonadota bacterium]